MPSKKDQIIIRGRAVSIDSFKPFDFEQAEINHVADGIRELGEDSRTGISNPTDLVNGSPLFHLEGLIRYQWLQLDCCKTGQITLDDLSNTSDFIHEEHHVDSLNCTKTSFYFRFLRHVVYLSNHPENIWEDEIERICESMAGMRSHIQLSLNASRKRSSQKRCKEILVEAFFSEFILDNWSSEDIKNSSIKKIANKIYGDLSDKHEKNWPEIGIIDVTYDDQTKVISYPNHKKKNQREKITPSQLMTKLRKIKKDFLG